MNPATLLHHAIVGDAVVSGAIGLLTLVAAGRLYELTDLPVPLLRAAGLVLIPYALALTILARRRTMAPVAIRAVIATNTCWALASALILVLGYIQPNRLGYAFVVGQALVVAAFAEAQHIGLRRAPALSA